MTCLRTRPRSATLELGRNFKKNLSQNVDTADWATKRRLLYLFGVKVFVYRTGTDADGQGHRWSIKHGWDGLEEL
jgi:hypothetical protein